MPLLDTRTPTITQIGLKDYKVVVVDAERGTSQDLSELCTGIQWDYDLDQAPEHYQISFAHAANIAGRVKPGDRIKIYGYAARPVGSNIEVYWELLKRIYIVDTELASETGGDLKAVGYNVMWFLMRNQDCIVLKNEKASDFINRTAAYYGIPMGTVADTGVLLQREPFVNRTLWDMWVTCLSYTRDLKPEARYLLKENQGKIDLVPRTEPGAVWEFSRGETARGEDAWRKNVGNIFSATCRFSMQNYVNVVRVYKGGQSGLSLSDEPATNDQTLVYQYPPQADIEAGKVAEINRYGMFATSVDLQMPGEEALNLGNDSSNAKQQGDKLFKQLNKIENTGSITSFNINTLMPGDPVHIRESISGLVGRYYIKSGNHTVTSSESSMTLTVNIEDKLPEQYEARHQAKSGGTLFGTDTGYPSNDSATVPTGPDPWDEVRLVTAGFTSGSGPAVAAGDDPHG